MITEIAFTGSPVTDIKRAREFYEGVLGFKPSMESAGGMWIEYEIGNGTFAIGCYGDQWKPSKEGTGIAFEVDDFDAEITRLKSRRREIFHWNRCPRQSVISPLSAIPTETIFSSINAKRNKF